MAARAPAHTPAAHESTAARAHTLAGLSRQRVREGLRDGDEALTASDLKALSAELSTALEIALPDADLESVRTRNDLVELILREIAARSERCETTDEPPTLHVRISAREGSNHWYLERSLPWTPYALETIWEDAAHAGHGSLVDVITPEGTPRSSIVTLEQHFAPLRYRGVRVRVRTDSATDPRAA